MSDTKFYLVAEINAEPQFREEVKTIFSKLLPTVLKEPGCEALYTTSTEGDPNRLVLFEVFAPHVQDMLLACYAQPPIGLRIKHIFMEQSP